jgi:carboxymethylenebutenolidase
MSGVVQIKLSPKGVPGAVTDPSSLVGEALTFPGDGGEQINGYLAKPAANGPEARAGVIVVHEAGGLGEHIKDVTNRIANLGYIGLGVDLYTREGAPPPTDDVRAMMERIFSIPDARALGDLEGAADFLRGRQEVNGKLGCLGFCMGGRYTLLFACSSDRLDAAVDCWGGFVDKATPEQRSTEARPTPPLELIAHLSCPLLAAIGAEDYNPSAEIGEQLRERALGSPLGKSGQEVKVDVYGGAGHAFFADYRPSYRPGPAAKLWAEIVPFFARHL